MDKEREAKIVERIIKDEQLKKQIVAMDAKAARLYLSTRIEKHQRGRGRKTA